MIAPTSFDPWVAGQGHLAFSAKAGKSPADAARAFEALLLRQILSAARSTSWLSGESETEAGWREMADDALAGHLARVGGLGLAKQIASLLMQTKSEGFGRTSRSFEATAQPATASPVLNPLATPTVNSR